MTRIFLFLTLVTAFQWSCKSSQPSSAITPTPTTAASRSTNDQLGRNNGVKTISEVKPSTVSSVHDGKVEYVDGAIFNTINSIIEKSEFLEKELIRALDSDVDVSSSSQFRRYFEHNIGGLLNVSQVQRSGAFGGKGIKSGELSKQLEQNEKTIDEILAVLGSGTNEYVRFAKELNGISEKYGVPLLEESSAETRLNKPMLLKAMMARLNSRYALIKNQMAVRS
ncbi:MAG TPA: hypothetical protein PKA82_00550 [Pyrinomonadaceae bacterium]|mgnify:CR=1 FL=1|nr:hypothetical protein [Pyrinomonadaceae bacterium]